MQRSIVWSGLAYDTEEHCAINYHDDIIVVRSEIEGWIEAVPVYVEYTVKLDLFWNVLEFDITFHVKDVQHSYSMICESGRWKDASGAMHPEFDGCRYIDISLTPFTNTLPVKGLGLKQGEACDIDVLYIDIMANEVRRDHQQYSRAGMQKYNFENGKGSFKATIEVDDDGFVILYPQLFRMLKPNNQYGY